MINMKRTITKEAKEAKEEVIIFDFNGETNS